MQTPALKSEDGSDNEDNSGDERLSFDLRVPMSSDTNCKRIPTVHVGKPRAPTIFTVSKFTACSNSSFFKTTVAALREQNLTAIVHLPEGDPRVFRVWLNWIMSYTIMSPVTHDKSTELEHNMEHMHLINTYVLDKKLEDVDFRDAVMDAIMAKSKTLIGGYLYPPGVEAINLIYKKTAPSSLLRDFVVDHYVDVGTPDLIMDDEEDYPYAFKADFLADLAMALMRKVKQRDGMDVDVDEEEVEEDVVKVEEDNEDETIEMPDVEDGEGEDGDVDETAGFSPCQYHEHRKTKHPCYRLRLED